MSVIIQSYDAPYTFRYLIQDILAVNRFVRLKQDRNKTQKLINNTITLILDNNNNMHLINQKFQFEDTRDLKENYMIILIKEQYIQVTIQFRIS